MQADEKKISDSDFDDDRDLAKEIRQGNRRSFEELYHQYYAKLCQFAYRYVKSRATAEDLVHNVFYNVWMKKENLKSGTLQAYLFTAVRNQSLKYIKQHKTRNHLKIDDLKIVKSATSTPEEKMAGQELKKAMIKAVRKLPSRRRLVYLMHREDDLTYREIAEVLNISIKTVETQMGRALKHLRKELAIFMPVILLFLIILGVFSYLL